MTQNPYYYTISNGAKFVPPIRIRESVKNYLPVIIGFLLIAVYQQAIARSVLRPNHTKIPLLVAHLDGNEHVTYQIRDSHIEEYPLFVAYDAEHFDAHRLCTEPISYRYQPELSVDGQHLNDLIEYLLQEVGRNCCSYRDFIVLQDKDFNYNMSVGLLVLSFKNYPFVLKLFIETPESFVNPWCKGVEQIWFFYMAGGVNRHITGLTRIDNMHHMRNRLADDPKWSTFIDTPRKWFWTPARGPWIKLIGKNMHPDGDLHAIIPGTYAIIADHIQKSNERTIFDAHRRRIALELCNTLDLYIDPHIDNFLIEQTSNKLVIIDTEHFPTLVGLKEHRYFKTYTRWYLGLAKKALHDIFFRPKSERQLAQRTRSKLSIFNGRAPVVVPAPHA